MKTLAFLTLLFAAGCTTSTAPSSNATQANGNVWREIKPDTGTLMLTTTLATLTDGQGTGSTSQITSSPNARGGTNYYFTVVPGYSDSFSLVLLGDTLSGSDFESEGGQGIYLTALFVREK